MMQPVAGDVPIGAAQCRCPEAAPPKFKRTPKIFRSGLELPGVESQGRH